jgi:hypothetical protein
MGDEVISGLWKGLLNLIESSELSEPCEDESCNFWILWYPKFQYRAQKNPPLDSILSQFNLVHTFTF